VLDQAVGGVKRRSTPSSVDSDPRPPTRCCVRERQGRQPPTITKASDKRLNEVRQALDKVLLSLALQVVSRRRGRT